MDIEKILKELREEHAMLTSSINALERLAERGSEGSITRRVRKVVQKAEPPKVRQSEA